MTCMHVYTYVCYITGMKCGLKSAQTHVSTKYNTLTLYYPCGVTFTLVRSNGICTCKYWDVRLFAYKAIYKH